MMRKDTVAPTAIDEHIGLRMQQRRMMLGFTQKRLAEICGITFQQIQKYESAANRVSASRLFQIGMALETPVSFFFSGLPMQSSSNINITSMHGKVSAPSMNDPLSKNETLELINLYYRLPNDDMRDTVMKLLKTMNGETA
ncbi:transcriptional regulator [Bacteroidia bacterium]|nr:transcriptional regulator [Bacteroidia bacterium]